MHYSYDSAISVGFGDILDLRTFKVLEDEYGKKFFLFSDLMINMGYSEKGLPQMCNYWRPRFIDAGILFVPLKSDIMIHGHQASNFSAHEGLIPIKLLGGLKYSIIGFMIRTRNKRYKSGDLITLAQFCLANYGEADESDKITPEQMDYESYKDVSGHLYGSLTSLKGAKLFESPVDSSKPFLLEDIVAKTESDEPKLGIVTNQVDIGTAMMELASSIRELSKAIIVANTEVPEPISRIAKEVVTDTSITWNISGSSGNNSHSNKPYSGL